MIAIRKPTTGEIQFVTSLIGYPGWEQYGPALPDGLDAGTLSRLVLVAGAWVEDEAQVEHALVKAIKDESERRCAALYTITPAKVIKYGHKRGEVASWQVTPAAAALPRAILAATFSFALADADARGDHVQDAIARFAGGINATKARVAAIEAAEQTCVDAIRAASGAKAKRAAAWAVVWP